MTDPRFAEIESHRPYLMRYALSQLRDAQLAEEAVQEALVAALESLRGFDGRSALRTWLTSILRFKVIDLQRRAVAERAHQPFDEEAEGGDESWLDDLFDATGHWREAPLVGRGKQLRGLASARFILRHAPAPFRTSSSPGRRAARCGHGGGSPSSWTA